MKLRIKWIAALLSLNLIFGETIFAQSGIFIEQDVSSDLIHISVDTGERQKSIAVTLKVLDNVGSVNYVSMGYTDEEGKTVFEYKNDSASGIFSVIASANGKRYETEYMKLSKEEADELIEVINEQLGSSVPDGSAVKQVFEKYRDGLNLNQVAFETLKNHDEIYTIMVTDAGNKGNVKTLSDVIQVFYKAVLTEAANEGEDPFYELLNEPIYFALLCGEQSPLGIGVKKASENVKRYALTKIPEGNISFEALKEKLELAFLSGRILKATHWNDVMDALSDYRKELAITLDGVNSEVYKNMMNKEYLSYADCAQAFQTLKNSGGKNDKPYTGGGSSGGGKGGSGSGFVLGPNTSGDAAVDIAQNSDLQKGKPEFKDMDDAKWAIQAVNYVRDKGIISGVDEETFEPNRSITRAEAVKMIAAMIGAEPQDIPLPFTDIGEEEWCYPYISAAYRLGLVKGKSDFEFAPNEMITRQEMAVMCYRAMDIMKISADSRTDMFFEDQADIAPWAAEAVNALLLMKIVSGSKGENGNIFRPNDNITRAESAMIIYQILKKAE